MIENISYEDMESYSKELKASVDAIKILIADKDLKELENFVEEVNRYSTYLESTVKLYKSADKALDYLKNRIKFIFVQIYAVTESLNSSPLKLL